MARTSAGELLPAVGVLLGADVTELEAVRRTPVDYDAFFAHRQVTRVGGAAIVRGAQTSWSLIEKRTEGPDRAAPYLYDCETAAGRRAA